jgi:DNA-binding protein YbaB
MNKLMQQAQQMQGRCCNAGTGRNEVVEASAGGGMVP